MGLLDRFLSKQITRDDFAKLVTRELASKGITKARYDANAFAVTIEGTSNALFLDNTYISYCAANKEQRAVLLEHLIGGLVSKPDIPHAFSAAVRNLMPVVRDSDYSSLAAIHIKARRPDTDTSKIGGPSKAVAEGLAASLAYDTEHSIMQVNHENFGRWGVPFEEAFNAAIENLREKTDTRLLKEEFPGVYHGAWGDSYESSRILLTDLIYRLSLYGEPVAFLPNRNELWVTGSRNLQALKPLVEAADEAHFKAHPLSPNLYLLSNGKWSVFVPEEQPLHDLCVNLRRKRTAVDYKQQKEGLEAIYKASKTNIFVASYTVYQRNDGTLHSNCVWSNGVDSLLPKAEFLTLVIDIGKKQTLTVPWEKAFPVLSPLMEVEPTLSPVRYRVRSFPSSEQIAVLQEKKEPNTEA